MKTKRILVALIVSVFALGAQAQSVDEIVNAHVAAIGGHDKIINVKTLKIERSMEVQGMNIPSVTTMEVGKAFRSESTVMGNVMVQVVKDSTGWWVRPSMMGGTGEPEDMPAEMVKQQAGQLDPFGALVNYKEKGNKIELIGKEKIDKKENFHLKITPAEGPESNIYLDATTYLLTRIKLNVSGTEAEINFSDYKAVDGIQFANVMDMTNPQMGVMTFVTEKVEVNPPVDAKIFEKPVK